MNGDIAVKEKKRKIYFSNGNQASLNNVTMFNGTGTFLRLQSDEGYILANTKNIDYMVIDGERVR